jgi:hypothetical protein
MESRDPKIIQNAIKNLITSCIEEKVNLDDMSLFETEYIFLQLRKMSVNNMVEVGFGHQVHKDCKHITKLEIDLDDLQFTGRIDNKIVLDEELMIGVTMKVPTNKVLERKYKTETEKVFGMITECIDTIFDAETVYNTKEVPKEELTKWVNTLNNVQIKKIADFFGDLPSFHYDVKFTCEKCGKSEEFEVNGLTNFL